MKSEISKYVASCKMCHWLKAPHHAQYGLIMSPWPSSRPWDKPTMDLIANLPQSMASEYTGILVIFDCLTRMATYVPCRRIIDLPELVWWIFKHMICDRIVPDNITTDCSTAFTGQFWDRVCTHLGINLQLLTPFPPADARSNWAAEPKNGAVPQGLLRLCSRQLGGTVTTDGICVQQLLPSFITDDTLLGELRVTFSDAIQLAQEPPFHITGAGRLVDGRHARHSPNSLGQFNRWSGATNTLWRRARGDCWGCRQCKAIDQKVVNKLALKKDRIQVHRTVYRMYDHQ